jgi:hypothetical protein
MTQERAVLVEAAESSRSKPGLMREVAENILRWLVVISAPVTKSTKYFLRSREFESSVAPAKSDGAQASIVANAGEQVIAPATKNSFTTATTANVKLDRIATPALKQDEIERRRDLVRKLFNDFWDGAHEKPAGFTERLDQAEDYLNERLAADGEVWQLNATTRALLGLPARLKSGVNGKNSAARR